MFLHWAIKNVSVEPIDDPFQIGVAIDGTVVMTFPITQMTASAVERKLSVPITVQGTGAHAVELIVDLNSQIAESNETDNVYSFIALFQAATPTPSPTPTPTPILPPTPVPTFSPTMTPTSVPPTATAVPPTVR